MTPTELFQAFARTRASLDGSEVTCWWTGDVYSWAPGEPYERLFGFEGVNVARLVPDEDEGAGPDAYRFLSREAAFYLDPGSREILETWRGKQVVHVWNDPANQRWRPFPVPMTHLGDQVCFSLEIPLAYPSPLPVADYPANSGDDTYRALELFQFYAPASVLTTDAPGVPASLSWTRMSPWLPWMEQGARPGGLTFHCRGRKLGSYEEVPERTRAYVAAHHPEFAHAPQKWAEPNETSWTYFRKLNPPA
ncbi:MULTISPECIES: DUF1838 family protein [unclassified Streptomyces]|uniref:DUF1838 family protein n=1 Tax=unclassified Streptomyces TaxID=2593676 RepID=UPI00225C2B53|nr:MULTISPECIES: DUF1838 family protein [unclassified Streptomyces]MCX4524214.1 DUF1838 domain-containing protein [Streptomyces sp. NBC_01551]MCX4545266.1 DUF1838 domain-containing protein [Streptomyces sp. NBC_01565]